MLKKEEIAEYLKAHPNESYRSVARLFETSHSFVIRISKSIKSVYENIAPKPKDQDVQSFYEWLKERSEREQQLDRKQTVANITLKESQPIGIAFTGDWHIGAKGIDYDSFEQDIELIENTEGLYSVGLGDYKDNQMPTVHPSGVFDEACSTELQDMLAAHFLARIAPMAIVRGCHEHWDWTISGKDIIGNYCDKLDPMPFNLWHGGTINISLGEQRYKIKARHKIPNESNLNTENAFRRWYDREGKADILAAAHKHDPFIKVMHRQNSQVAYIRCGSYKKYDEFGQRLAGYEGTKAIPVAVLFPNEHRFVVFEQLRDGIAFLKGVRS